MSSHNGDVIKFLLRLCTTVAFWLAKLMINPIFSKKSMRTYQKLFFTVREAIRGKISALITHPLID